MEILSKLKMPISSIARTHFGSNLSNRYNFLDKIQRISAYDFQEHNLVRSHGDVGYIYSPRLRFSSDISASQGFPPIAPLLVDSVGSTDDSRVSPVYRTLTNWKIQEKYVPPKGKL